MTTHEDSPAEREYRRIVAAAPLIPRPHNDGAPEDPEPCPWCGGWRERDGHFPGCYMLQPHEHCACYTHNGLRCCNPGHEPVTLTEAAVAVVAAWNGKQADRAHMDTVIDLLSAALRGSR